MTQMAGECASTRKERKSQGNTTPWETMHGHTCAAHCLSNAKALPAGPKGNLHMTSVI